MPVFLLLFTAAICRADSLSASDIVDWNLTITDSLATPNTVTLEGPLSGNNSVLFLVGADLTSTASGLFFNYSGTDGGALLFQIGLFSGSNFWCNSSMNHQFLCSFSNAGAESVAAGAPSPGGFILPTGNVEIGSGGTVVGSDIVYTVDQSWADGANTFGVVGTITTDGAIRAPEPSTLSFLAVGMSFLAFVSLGVLRKS